MSIGYSDRVVLFWKLGEDEGFIKSIRLAIHCGSGLREANTSSAQKLFFLFKAHRRFWGWRARLHWSLGSLEEEDPNSR